MENKAFKHLWFSDNDIKIFLTCVKSARLNASEIIKKCGISKSSAHLSLNNLVDRGYLFIKNINKNIYYFPINWEEIINKFNYKQSELIGQKDDLLNYIELNKTYKMNAWDIEVSFYEWTNWIKSLYNQILNLNSPMKGINNAGSMFELLKDFFTNFIKERTKKGIKINLICPSNQKIQQLANKYREVNNFDEKKYQFSWDIKVCANQVSIFSFKEEEPVGISITNKDIAKNFWAIFDMLWEMLSKQKNN